MNELVAERVDIPEGAKAIVVDRTHVGDPEVKFIKLRKSLSEGHGTIEEDIEVLLKKK
jgi:hypothetical protein